MTPETLLRIAGDSDPAVPYGFLDEFTKTCVRKAIVKAICIPGYQVPYVSEELPVARGFGTGGLQITLSLVGADDVIKVIDEGDDDTVNAANLRRFITGVTGNRTTTETAAANIIQTRHRIPEQPLSDGQIVVLQAAFPCPLRFFERNDAKTRKLHARADYSLLWLRLYESIVEFGEIMVGTRYPVTVNRRYAMDPTPIPRWDLRKLHRSQALAIFCAGREKRIYAVPPHTEVIPLSFEDHAFTEESFSGQRCALCGSDESYLVKMLDDRGREAWVCSDTSWCKSRRGAPQGE